MPDELPAGSGGAPEQQPQPTIDWESPDNPYRKRYEDTHAWGNGLNERVQKYESDPQAYYELGAKHGVQFDFEEPAAAEPDPGADPRVAQLEQQNAELMTWREQVEAERQERIAAENEQRFQSDLDGWAKEAGITLSKWDRSAIREQTFAAEEPGTDVAKAVFDAFLEDARSNQPRPRVPTPPTGGQPNTGAPNWGEMSEDAINQHMAQRFAGNA